MDYIVEFQVLFQYYMTKRIQIPFRSLGRIVIWCLWWKMKDSTSIDRYSPVFKAMLSNRFKEAEAKESPLPEKKADEVLNFLKQLYMKDRDEITCG